MSAFVTPSSPLSAVTTGLVNNVTPLRMTAENKGDNTEPWSVMKILRGVVGTASETKAKVDATVSLLGDRDGGVVFSSAGWVSYRV